MLPIGGKSHVFGTGMMTLPDELSLANYQTTYVALFEAGYTHSGTQSSPMALLGSTIGSAQDPYRYLKTDGTHGMLPRLLTGSRD